MDGAKALCSNFTVGGMCGSYGCQVASGGHEAPTSKKVATVSAEGFGVGQSGAAVGADLGGSSKYSSETLED